MSKSIEDRVYSECFNPQKVKIFDNLSHKDKYIYVPCGKCYHCLITKVNEWVTRMTAQSMYSKNTYYVTLTYDSSLFGTKFFSETDPTFHSCNKEKKFMPAPLILNKSHLQKFFKRLRKNTGLKFQYFAVGEYGHNFGRPHFHFLLWTDDSLTAKDVEFSWSINVDDKRKLIGDVDFQDLNKDCINPEHPYKYVCKYLQKKDFEFKKLPTFKYHYENYIKNYKGLSMPAQRDFADYEKEFAPFFLCSKRPAIGYCYFEKNKGRFQERDYRLFELPDNSVFPSYFFRKTRESLCPYKTISVTNGKPNSFASLPDVVSLLNDLQDCISFNEGFCVFNRTYEWNFVDNYEWRRSPEGIESGADRLPNGEIRQDTIVFESPRCGKVIFPKKYFDFYDCKNKFTYSLACDFMYNVIDSRKRTIYRVSIPDVVKEVSSSYDRLLNDFLIPHHAVSVMNDKIKKQQILDEYGSEDAYLEAKKKCVNNLLNVIRERQRVYNITKNKF